MTILISFLGDLVSFLEIIMSYLGRSSNVLLAGLPLQVLVPVGFPFKSLTQTSQPIFIIPLYFSDSFQLLKSSTYCTPFSNKYSSPTRDVFLFGKGKYVMPNRKLRRYALNEKNNDGSCGTPTFFVYKNFPY